MCTKCVNCAYYLNSPKNRFNISVGDSWGVEENFVTQQVLKIKEVYFKLFNIDLLHVLQTAVRNNYYIFGYFNERYVPNTWAFNWEDYIHDFLIIGCDDEKNISVGFAADGRFKRIEIPNENLINGLFRTTDTRINLDFLSYNVGEVPVPNIKRIINDLKKYISTSNYLENPTLESNLHGIATNIRLKDFFLDEINKGEIYIDKRYVQVLYEHKWVLTKLVELFVAESDSGKKKYQTCANKNFEREKIVHMLGLKMQYTKDPNIVYRVAELIDQIIAEEIEYIPPLIELLETKYLKELCV